MKTKLIILGLIIVAIVGGLLLMQSRNSVSFEAGSENTLSENEIEDIIAGVRAHIVLPDDEVPLIATITDVDALAATQPFYRDAKNGDLLIIYQSISKAIIYDTENDVLVNVGPIIFDSGAQAQAAEELTEEETTTDETSEE